MRASFIWNTIFRSLRRNGHFRSSLNRNLWTTHQFCKEMKCALLLYRCFCILHQLQWLSPGYDRMRTRFFLPRQRDFRLSVDRLLVITGSLSSAERLNVAGSCASQISFQFLRLLLRLHRHCYQLSLPEQIDNLPVQNGCVTVPLGLYFSPPITSVAYLPGACLFRTVLR